MVNGISGVSAGVPTAPVEGVDELKDEIQVATDEKTVAEEKIADEEGEVVIEDNTNKETISSLEQLAQVLKDLIVSLTSKLSELLTKSKEANVPATETVDETADAAAKPEVEENNNPYNLSDEQLAYIQLYRDNIAEKIVKSKKKTLVLAAGISSKAKKDLDDAIASVPDADIQAYVKVHWDELQRVKKLKSIFKP